MADERTPLPFEADEDTDLIDSDQWFNLIRGINRGKDGLLQMMESVKEGLSLSPEGSTEFLTQQMIDDQKILEEETSVAGARKGAAVFDFAGEVLPYLVAPLGQTKTGAAVIGGAIGSTLFKEDFDANRAPDIALGAVGGIVARGAFDLFRGPARAELAASIPSRTGTDLIPSTHPDFVHQGVIVPDAPQGLFPGGGGAATRAPQRQLTREPLLSGADQSPANVVGRQRGIKSPERTVNRLQDQFQLKANPNAAKIKAEEIMEAEAKARMTQKQKDLDAGFKVIEDAKKSALYARSKPARDILKATERKLAQDQLALKVIRSELGKFPGKKKADPQNPAIRNALQRAAGRQEAGGGPTQEALKKGDFPARRPTAAQRRAEAADAVEPTQPQAVEEVPADALTGRARRGTQTQARGSQFGPGRQGGFINNDLQAILSGATVGGIVGGVTTDSPEGALAGAALGAVGLTAASRRLARQHVQRKPLRDESREGAQLTEDLTNLQKARINTGEAMSASWQAGKKILDSFLGSIDTRLASIVPRVAVGLRNMEFRQHQISGDWMRRGDDFFLSLERDLSDKQFRKFKIIASNDRDKGERYLRAIGKDDLADKFQDVGAVLEEAREYLGTVGLGVNLVKGYMPRQVADTDFFSGIEEVETYFDFLRKQKGQVVRDFERETITSDLLNDAITRGQENVHYARAAKALKKRHNVVDESNVDAYQDLHQAFNNYAEEITRQVERRKFFKGQNTAVDDLGPEAENIDTVVKRFAKELETNPNLTSDGLDESTRLIRMRFGPGEQAPSRAVQNFKNLTYAGLLGNPLSAATQFGDVALSAYRNGLANTAVAMTRVLANRNRPLASGLSKTELLGLRDAATDFTSRVGTRDLLDWSLKYSGFRGMDRLGKDTFIGAAMMKNQKLDYTEFQRKWRPIFDPDSPAGSPTPRTQDLYQQVQDFEKIDATNQDTIGFMLWNELADVQPISLSSMPEQYLANPNGRMAYMLQTFTLRLFDLMRRDIGQKVAAGEFKQATKNAARLSTLFVTMNGTVDQAKDFVLGRDSTLPDTVLNNYLKLLGMNKYMVGNIAQEGFGTALKQSVVPTAILDITSGEDLIKMTPPFGKALGGFLPE